MRRYHHTWLSPASLILALGLTLTGCNNMTTLPAPDTAPINTTTPSTSPSSPLDQQPATKCPAFDPNMTMCTMQFDPVCVKVKSATGFTYHTASNSCTACTSPEAISYQAGECQ